MPPLRPSGADKQLDHADEEPKRSHAGDDGPASRGCLRRPPGDRDRHTDHAGACPSADPSTPTRTSTGPVPCPGTARIISRFCARDSSLTRSHAIGRAMGRMIGPMRNHPNALWPRRPMTTKVIPTVSHAASPISRTSAVRLNTSIASDWTVSSSAYASACRLHSGVPYE